MAQIRHSIVIDAAPAVVHALVSSGDGFSRWWAADVTQTGADGTADLGFFNRATIYRLKPVQIVAPGEARWRCETGQEWIGTELLFQLTQQKPDQTLLRFTHAAWQSETDYFVSCTTVWGELMFRLKAAAEGHGRGPLFAAGSLAY